MWKGQGRSSLILICGWPWRRFTRTIRVSASKLKMRWRVETCICLVEVDSIDRVCEYFFVLGHRCQRLSSRVRQKQQRFPFLPYERVHHFWRVPVHNRILPLNISQRSWPPSHTAPKWVVAGFCRVLQFSQGFARFHFCACGRLFPGAQKAIG